jgi:hypothetical protein
MVTIHNQGTTGLNPRCYTGGSRRSRWYFSTCPISFLPRITKTWRVETPDSTHFIHTDGKKIEGETNVLISVCSPRISSSLSPLGSPFWKEQRQHTVKCPSQPLVPECPHGREADQELQFETVNWFLLLCTWAPRLCFPTFHAVGQSGDCRMLEVSIRAFKSILPF